MMERNVPENLRRRIIQEIESCGLRVITIGPRS
jgi:hypothetical protein